MGSVPLTIRADDDPGTALLYVVAAVDGVEQEFLLDTGAARSHLPRSAQTEHWAIDVPDPQSRGVFGSSATGPQARVPDITLGPIVAHDVVVDVSDDGPAILGVDVLAGHRIGVRLSAHALQIDEQAAIDRWRPLQLSSRGHPLLKVVWDATTAVAVWDTGASTTVVDAGLAAAFPGIFPATGTTSGTDVNGQEGSAGMVRVSPCRIGGRGFAVSTAATVPLAGLEREGDPAFTIIIGRPLIAQADWVFDFRARMWGYLDRV
ncbi:aspartyl protease family protein [Microbacterium horticulturae]|uniref:Aspartyl protease family protein n=1 Tax=Microbacterium horticulturae TaxID=3028316 RepID=A0ABY8BZ99_9MICO|nr:aspartyl protease family protein [Microbacterium sp. KACC 23027]WEG09534.1 aspartyl protease family protein [Microbacterium sp. KACC 23027]